MTSTNINDSAYATLNTFALLASSELTSVNTTTITNGNYGTPNGTGIAEGFVGTLVTGTNATTSQTQLTTLKNAINAVATTGTTPGGTGQIIYTPGKYEPTTGLSISYTGAEIIFDAQNNPNAQFFIQASSSITFASVASITLINGASTCNIFWVAGSEAISFTGTSPPSIPGIFIAGSAITFANASLIVGRLYAQTANVTFSGNSAVNGICTDKPQDIICYLKGSLILTKKGFVPIENIKAGDDIITKGKIYKQKYVDKDASLELTPVIWISKFNVLKLNSKSRPICITKNALGKNLPFKDLYVSPDHSLLLNGTMVNAKHMVNGTTIYQDEECESVEYYHLECKNHRAIFANGILSETYLEGLNNRDVFDYSVKLRPKFNFKKIYALR